MAQFEVNGHEYSFTSIRASLGTLTGDMISSINYSDGLEPGIVMGGDGTPIGMTKGTYSPELSMEFHTRRKFQQFFDSLGPFPYEKYFTVSCAYAEDNVSPVIEDTIPLCRLKKSSVSSNKGSSDAVAIPIEIAVGGVILWNGKPAVSQRQD